MVARKVGTFPRQTFGGVKAKYFWLASRTFKGLVDVLSPYAKSPITIGYFNVDAQSPITAGYFNLNAQNSITASYFNLNTQNSITAGYFNVGTQSPIIVGYFNIYVGVSGA